MAGKSAGVGARRCRRSISPTCRVAEVRGAGVILAACVAMQASQWKTPHHPSPINRLTIAARSKSSMHDCKAFTHNQSTPKLHNNTINKAPLPASCSLRVCRQPQAQTRRFCSCMSRQQGGAGGGVCLLSVAGVGPLGWLRMIKKSGFTA